MPAIVIGKDSNGNFTYHDANTGQATDQAGNVLKTTNTANTTANGIQNAINSMKSAQIASAMASLAKARDSALSNLSVEKAAIQPAYYKKRNAESTQSQLQAKNFAEFMANRGGNSGSSAQAELARGVALQGNIGALNEQEAGDYATNARRVADVQNAYENDLASAKAGAEATAMQQMIQQMNADRTYQQSVDQFNKSFGVQEAGVTGKYNGQDTLAALQDAYNRKIQEAQLMGTYNGQDTLAARELAQNILDSNRAYELQKQQFAASQARSSGGGSYRSSGKSSGSSSNTNNSVAKSNASTKEVGKQIIDSLKSGATVWELLDDLNEMDRNGTAAVNGVDTNVLRSLVNSVPIDNWQYIRR
jgi:hypothetical protein